MECVIDFFQGLVAGAMLFGFVGLVTGFRFARQLYSKDK